jgi:hypothetical protein
MSFVVYDKVSTLRLDRLTGTYMKEYYSTEAAAKAALTRAKKADDNLARYDFLIAPYAEFYKNIEKLETCTNLMSGKPFQQGVNTPLCLDPSSETYWSM